VIDLSTGSVPVVKRLVIISTAVGLCLALPTLEASTSEASTGTVPASTVTKIFGGGTWSVVANVGAMSRTVYKGAITSPKSCSLRAVVTGASRSQRLYYGPTLFPSFWGPEAGITTYQFSSATKAKAGLAQVRGNVNNCRSFTVTYAKSSPRLINSFAIKRSSLSTRIADVGSDSFGWRETGTFWTWHGSATLVAAVKGSRVVVTRYELTGDSGTTALPKSTVASPTETVDLADVALD